MSRGHPSIALLACGVVAALGCEPPAETREPPEPSAPVEPAPPRPNVLWVTIDTLRPDHFSPYGYVRDTSPGLDQLAREGVRFDSVIAQGPWTFSSVPSIVTSRYPQSHRDMIVDGHPEAVIAEGSRSVARELSAAGYRTVLISGHGAMGAIFDICDGFDACAVEYERAGQVTDRALEAVREAGDQPVFLWAYYIDPHVPYEAPEELVEAFASDGLVETGLEAGRSEMEFVGHERIPGAAWVEGQRDLDWYVAAYDAEIRYTDRQVERLVRGLAEMRGDWLTMVFADHGESLTEHGLYLSHSVNLHDPILRIPWLLRWPERVPAGHAIDADVMGVDIAPTLLGLLERTVPEPWVGRDLSGCVLGREPCVARPAYAYYRGGDEERVTMRLWPDKVICEVDGTGCALYDLRADPAEETDLCARDPERCGAMRDAAIAWHRAQPRPAFERDRVEALSEETRAVLRALGYVE